VIRAIGYLNLCQYGDAYRALTLLEREYRPYLEKIEKYLSRPTKPDHHQTVKSFLKAGKAPTDIDGLPGAVVREIARHRDFINLQKSLNRLIDEKPYYGQFEGHVERELKSAQAAVTETRVRIEELRKRLATANQRKDQPKNQPKTRESISELTLALEKQYDRLNDQFFMVDLYSEAKVGMTAYRSDVAQAADKRLSSMREKIDRVLANRLKRLKTDLARILDNNELLRYEVFAGSGENIRYQVAGGEVEKRIPASVLPKSKSLQWEFDGEYWEDEIGHFRSSLKNNCPGSSGRQIQAQIEGDDL
jgi:DNA repair exonuclease SbcCD ATPase subunit